MIFLQANTPQGVLKRWKDAPVTGVRIVAPPPPASCDLCRRAHGTEYTIEEALAKNPLPHACDCPECQCAYAPLL